MLVFKQLFTNFKARCSIEMRKNVIQFCNVSKHIQTKCSQEGPVSTCNNSIEDTQHGTLTEGEGLVQLILLILFTFLQNKLLYLGGQL